MAGAGRWRSVTSVEHGGILEKQVRKKSQNTRGKKSSGRPRKQPPVDVPAAVDESSHSVQPSGKEESGFLSQIGNLFSSNSSSEGQNPMTQTQSASADHGTPISSSGELSPEQQQQLHAVPDVIGEQPVAAGVTDVGTSSMLSVLDNVAFSEQDVTDALTELFSYLSGRFDSDHWLLTERQQRMLGGPTAQLVNGVWAKLRTKLPDILARWAESTPGATAFMMAFGIVVVPKVMTQVKLSREKQSPAPVKAETAAERKPAAKVQQTAGPVPVATGFVGGGA